VVAYARGANLIRSDVDVKTLIVPSFVREGLKELSLDHYWAARATP
jgi:hypothetical protein